VGIQIFALRVYTLAATKLTATQGARSALNQIRDDIRQGKIIQVGSTDNNGNFTSYGGTNLAVGNALQVFYQTNLAAPYSLYWLQTNVIGSGISSNVLYWVSATTSSSTTQNLAVYITNTDIFAAEDWNAWPTNTMVIVPTSNNVVNDPTYSVKMQFYQWEYPIAVVGGAGLNAYDFFQVRTRVCRRATD
jgi:hypothetical protein